MNNRFRVFFSVLAVAVLAILASECTKKDPAGTPEAIDWMTDLDHAFEEARAQNKPLMIEFMAEWCPTCQKMDATTFKSTDVIQKSTRFIAVRIDVDEQGELADSYNSNAGKYGGIGIPNILFLDKNGSELKHPIGYRKTETFLAVMDSVLTMVSR